MVGRLFLVLLCYSFSANATEVQERVLSNGLKVLVKEEHRSPVVVSQIWYKVGSSYESSGITGISHMLEHMMFKGTDSHPVGEFSAIIAENGGRENAFTGRDYTAYFQTLEKTRLAISFELEADRMQHLHLLAEELDKELQVVMEERRMRTEDKPRAKLQEYLMAMAYSNSPYRNPVIGWPSDIENYQVDDLKKWYQQWYAPNNATLIVAGDVQAEEVFKLAEQYFGPIPVQTIQTLKPQVEMPQVGVRRMTVKLAAKVPYILMAYKVPSLKTVDQKWEAYALDVLAAVLDGGDSARLPAKLQRGQQLTSSVGAGYDLGGRLEELFMFEATPVKGKTLLDMEIALKTEIRSLQRVLISEQELARVKAQVLASSVYEQDSLFYQAMKLGMAETVGLGWKTAEQYRDKIDQVTAEQVRLVADKYLLESQLSIAYLEPQTMSAVHAQGAHHAH
ncbi:MAG TPA: insulinase family protein [Methyloprofundus sp.]|uniref:M16 family metallopeptidase n=1 Tax=Methyloprofundus sp. TaxID=2020875 RepID=UPI0017FBB146|nr:pitrilysin family protein [Methyloprofundus sp.]HIG64453.1 insulinase family protein [Methyloprofundus sp.]HIL79422.1 insulinase family protein [Methylococcales bacterium]